MMLPTYHYCAQQQYHEYDCGRGGKVGDSEVFSGDYINIRVNGNGFTSGQTYTVQIMYIPAGIIICEKSFTR